MKAAPRNVPIGSARRRQYMLGVILEILWQNPTALATGSRPTA